MHVEKAYKKWGRDCVHHLYVDFAFVVEEKENKGYFAARDIVGSRPLYYGVKDEQFYCSSDISDFFLKFAFKAEPDVEMLRTLIDEGTLPSDATLFMSIKRLSAGHCMVVDKEANITIERYWNPENIKINHNITEQEATSTFLRLFQNAIRDRVEDPEETSFDLSGGLDSSSVVAMATQMFPKQKIQTNSQGFSSLPSCDEKEYIEAMTDTFNLDSHIFESDSLDYNGVYSLETHYKQKPPWPILLTYMAILPLVENLHRMKIKRVLTGQGGDDILTGNGFVLFDYFRSLQWRQLYRELKAAKRPVNAIKRYMISPLLSDKQKQVIKFIFRKKSKKPKSKNSLQEQFQSFPKKDFSFLYDIDSITCSYQSLTWDISPYHDIEKRYGIVYTHPFFDRRLIEFMLSLPGKYKYREGVGKVLLRKAMKGILPEKIRQRKDKAEFSALVRQQIDAIDLDKLLDHSCLAAQGVIEQVSINRLKEEYKSGKMKTIVHFWKIINMEYWYRCHFLSNEKEVSFD